MKKVLKILGILLLILAIVGVVLFMMNNESKPKGEPGAKAEALAQKMLMAVNKPAWDTTNYVQWSFPGGHDYLWDRRQHMVQVKWEDTEVLLNPNQVTGTVKKAGQTITGADADKAVQDAWGYFCNDSFWLIAPTKIYDKGVERSYVKLDGGREGLMVTYVSGGVTPGDSYLWILDEKGLPTSYKMWVSIIPLGGTEFTWEDWTTLPTGAKVAQNHKGLLEIPITNIAGGQTLASVGLSENIFK